MGHALSVTHACRRIDIVTRVLVQSPSRGCALPLDRSRCGSMDVNLGKASALLPATVRSPGGMIGRRVSLVARPRRRELTRNHTTPPCCGSLARTRASANVVINLIVSTRRLAGALYAQLAGAGGCCVLGVLLGRWQVLGVALESQLDRSHSSPSHRPATAGVNHVRPCERVSRDFFFV